MPSCLTFLTEVVSRPDYHHSVIPITHLPHVSLSLHDHCSVVTHTYAHPRADLSAHTHTHTQTRQTCTYTRTNPSPCSVGSELTTSSRLPRHLGLNVIPTLKYKSVAHINCPREMAVPFQKRFLSHHRPTGTAAVQMSRHVNDVRPRACVCLYAVPFL